MYIPVYIEKQPETVGLASGQNICSQPFLVGLLFRRIKHVWLYFICANLKDGLYFNTKLHFLRKFSNPRVSQKLSAYQESQLQMDINPLNSDPSWKI